MSFSDPNLDLSRKSLFKATTAIRVTFPEPDGSAVEIFSGTVTEVAVSSRESGRSSLEVVAHDGAYELGRVTRAATYLEQTASDIITKLVRGASLTPKVTSTQKKLDYALQADTDLVFIDELCRRNGFDWLADDTTFHAWKRGTSTGSQIEVAMGATLVEFTARASNDGPTEVTVRGWDHLNKQEVAAKAEKQRTKLTATGFDSLVPQKSTRAATALDGGAMPADQAEATSLAEIDLDATRTVVARGRCRDNPALAPGRTLKVTGTGPADGTYYVNDVEHRFTYDGFETSFVAGDRGATTLVPIERGRSAPRHDGLVVGLVTAIEDDPENAGRVKVSFPGLDPNVESQWGRLATIGGGAERGAVFLPEVGDEVLVGFEGGDLRRPVVLGGLFGKKDKIPDALVKDGKVVHRSLTSRLGHVVELADGDAPEDQHIRLALAGEKVSLRLGKDKADLALPDGVPLTIAVGSSKIAFDGNGAIELSGTKITLKASSGDVIIEGVNVTTKAQMKAATSGTEVELKANAKASVESSGITSVKGSMVQIN